MRHKRRLHAGRGYGCCNRVKGGGELLCQCSRFRIRKSVQRANAARGIQSRAMRPMTGGVRFASLWFLTNWLTCRPALCHPPPPLAIAPPCSALGCSVSCFWFACLRFLRRSDATFTFHVISDSRTRSSGREIRLLFCHLPIWAEACRGGWWWWCGTRRHCLWSNV